MSKTLVLPPSHFLFALDSIFKRMVEVSGGSVVKSQMSEDRLDLEASFRDNKYYLNVVLVWTGSRYEVERFESVETVRKLGENVYLPAGRVLLYELGGGKRWQVVAPKSLRALFEAHTDWSIFMGYPPIFFTH